MEKDIDCVLDLILAPIPRNYGHESTPMHLATRIRISCGKSSTSAEYIEL
jgi:hypothetical protein